PAQLRLHHIKPSNRPQLADFCSQVVMAGCASPDRNRAVSFGYLSKCSGGMWSRTPFLTQDMIMKSLMSATLILSPPTKGPRTCSSKHSEKEAKSPSTSAARAVLISSGSLRPMVLDTLPRRSSQAAKIDSWRAHSHSSKVGSRP